MEALLDADVISGLKLLSKKENDKQISDDEYYKRLADASDEIKRIKIYDRIDNVRSLNNIQDEQWKKIYLEKTKKYLLPLSDFDSDLKKQLETAIAAVKI